MISRFNRLTSGQRSYQQKIDVKGCIDNKEVVLGMCRCHQFGGENIETNKTSKDERTIIVTVEYQRCTLFRKYLAKMDQNCITTMKV